ncbi:nuclear pore complex protein Nup98-Nup96 isoform X2 [Manduca sexta]|uniref:nuclear pore complex protein Nup98-Nup96 isoform X2 n=1 Tax=Manduca sexta TaxID=7130 RepID=UPI00188F6006|nr:nuclear pore complex protein Nup98-Nup96 isoform X2 [Manduca sexta]
MFQKPTFGSNATSGFGSFNSAATTSSPFGFKPTNTTFGAAAATQPTTGGGLFSSNTPGGLFGAAGPSTSTSTFGANTSAFGFGASTSSGGLFANNTSTGLFGNAQNTSAFGAKPTGFGFSNTSTTGATGGGLFGSTPAAGGGLFGQQQNTMSGGGLFGSATTGAFGQQQQTGTAHVKYNPVVGTDVVVKSGNSQNINIKHHCITCMKEYENKSLEELRLEDYAAGRKGSTTGMFGGFQQPVENKPLFGATGFGQPATTSAPSMFGGGGLGTNTAFGQNSTFSFNSGTQNATNTNTLFGASKPAFGAASTTGTGLFGAASTQAPTFGTNTSTFGFGANTQTQGGGIFGAKPPTSGFGATPASSGFGAFNTGGAMFGAKTSAPTFGTSGPAFGTLSSGFATNTSTSSGLFNTNAFGKPATTQPTFGFNTQPSVLGGGLGAGFGANTFQAKPAGTFGTPAGGMFQQPNANNTFKTGLDSGLSTGMFNNTSTLGSSAFGLGGLNANNSALGNLSGAGAGAGGRGVHEQVLALAARPYGDQPLYKDLLPDHGTTAEEVLKPTNPAALKAVLERADGAYKVASPHAKLRVQPRHSLQQDKKSLFDGLEESDATLEDKLCLKPSRKRLVLRNHASNEQRSEQHSEQRSEQHSEHGEQRSERNDSNTRGDSRLSSPKQMIEKEKPVDLDSNNLDKESSNTDTSERRASWLTTKPLRKPPLASVNPDVVENSVRELAVRQDISTADKENIDTLSVSEEENAPTSDAPPHPTGVKLTRPGYYTIPTLDEMIGYMRPDGSCVVPHLTIGRKNYGNVYYNCEIDVAGLDLDALVHFLNKEVIVYPEDADKPPVGHGLNRRAIVTLDRVWPMDKTEKRPITDPDRLLKMDYEGKLRRVCDKHDTKFIEYRPQTGSWVFKVEHFSKYGLTDSDEEDEHTPAVMKLQLVNQALQTNAAQAPKPPAPASAGLGGLGSPGLGGLAQLGGTLGTLASSEDMFAMQQTSLNLLNGTGKAFDMDTTEDNGESASLYQDNLAYGMKSPTSELARLENRQSHHVQLMKASLYNHEEMEDMESVSGEQLVPLRRSLSPVTGATPSLAPSIRPAVEREQDVITDEVKMPPLIVQPHSIVLRYHRKVPPFKETIAGRAQASLLADMSFCRARHSRVGFGPAGQLVFPTSYDSIAELPKCADLSSLCRYVRGRGPYDWSEPVAARLQLAHRDQDYNIQNILEPYLNTLLEYSTFSEVSGEQCPRLTLKPDPQARLSTLKEFLKHASKQNHKVKFGVLGAYCYEVWKLCDALWAADLENDGVPGTDDISIVKRHKKLLEWFRSAVADVTDRELAKPTRAEKEDETDGHSERVWTLLLGGRVVEACKVARDNGDLNMATLIAMASGDPKFRYLISRQLSVWRECGADALISSHKLATLQLIAGVAPLSHLVPLDWTRALHATARYICPHLPTLEQIIRTYEGYFSSDEEVDLSAVGDESGMQPPLPPYASEYDVIINQNGSQRRVLDARYSLLRARAHNTRPRMRPAAYTPDPLDYSLCFLLGVWFGNPSIESITGVADQLEACGAWHLAVLALAYHPDDRARGHLVRGMISRHAPEVADTAQTKACLDLLRKLRVPEKWILLAQAHRAKYLHMPELEATHLAGAEQWNAAHRVLVDDLLPEAVLSEKLWTIAPLLEKLNDAAQRHEISGWESGGQALYHYYKVCEEIRAIADGACVPYSSGAALAAGAALGAMAARARSPLAAAACAEMGARAVQLWQAQAAPAHRLAHLLRALALPPDMAAAAAHKITTELASRAAAQCGESASSAALTCDSLTLQ